MNIIKCKLCGKEFEPHHWNVKYCSNECREKAYREQIASYNAQTKLKKVVEKQENSNKHQSAQLKQESINDIQEIGEIRELLKSLKTITDQLRKKCEMHNIKHEALEKQRILLDHQLESYKNTPSCEVMEENNLQRYGILKARRVEKILSKGIYEIISMIPPNPEQQFMQKLAYQEELNEKYDKQKEWNTDKWKISGVPKINIQPKGGENNVKN